MGLETLCHDHISANRLTSAQSSLHITYNFLQIHINIILISSPNLTSDLVSSGFQKKMLSFTNSADLFVLVSIIQQQHEKCGVQKQNFDLWCKQIQKGIKICFLENFCPKDPMLAYKRNCYSSCKLFIKYVQGPILFTILEFYVHIHSILRLCTQWQLLGKTRNIDTRNNRTTGLCNQFLSNASVNTSL